MPKMPTFARGSTTQIETSIESGVLTYPSYVFFDDTETFGFLDEDMCIHKIHGDNIKYVEELPRTEDALSNILYIKNNDIYIFNGTDFYLIQNEATNDRKGMIKLSGNTFNNTTLTGSTSINGENAYVNSSEIAALGNAVTKNAQVNGQTISENADTVNITAKNKVNISGNTEVAGTQIIIGSVASNTNINGKNLTVTSPATFTKNTTFNSKAVVNSNLEINGKETVNDVQVKNNVSVSTGNNSFTGNNESIAVGKANTITGSESLIVGQQNEVSGSAINSATVGFKNGVSSKYSLVVGEGNQTNQYAKGQLIAGSYNDTASDSDLLILGGGYYDNNGTLIRRNALVVGKDGEILSGKNINITHPLHGNEAIITPDKNHPITVHNPNGIDYNFSLLDDEGSYISGYHQNTSEFNFQSSFNSNTNAAKLKISSSNGIDSISISYHTKVVGYYSIPEVDKLLKDALSSAPSVIKDQNGININASDGYTPNFTQTQGVLNLGGKTINLKTNSSAGGAVFIGDEYKYYPHITMNNDLEINGGSSYGNIILKTSTSKELRLGSSSTNNSSSPFSISVPGNALKLYGSSPSSAVSLSADNFYSSMNVMQVKFPSSSNGAKSALLLGKNFSSGNTMSSSPMFVFGNGLKFNGSVSNGGGNLIVGNYNTNSSDVVTNNLLVVGNGANKGDTSNGANALRLTNEGYLYYNTGCGAGADYAEFFEWSDGNPDNEDRCGLFVTFDFDKEYNYQTSSELPSIKIAQPGEYILGVISGNPSFVGNSDEEWKKRWLYDDFDRPIVEAIQVPITEIHEVETGEFRTDIQYDDSDNEIEVQVPITEFQEVETGEFKTEFVQVQNPDYDASKNYTSRFDRKEWETTGMLGVLSVCDDGTCEPRGFCKCGENGIATKSERREVDTFLVLRRVNDNVVKIVFK